MKTIEINENGLQVLFDIREDGTVELQNFSPSGFGCTRDKNGTEEQTPEEASRDVHPLIELQVTGKTTRGMHAYKHNMSSDSLDLKYQGHVFRSTQNGKELIISLAEADGLKAEYHMRFFDGIPAVQVWSVLENTGKEKVGLEYVSSFVYHNLCGDGALPYYEKTDIYVPNNTWSSEAQWRKRDAREVGLSGMSVDGFNTPGSGTERFCYSGRGSWSTCEYLPMGFAADRETGVAYCFQIEHSGEWHAEYGSEPGHRLYLALSGPTSGEHGWWKCLNPGDSFTTVPAAFGSAAGGLSGAAGVLTRYRRAIRRQNTDDEKLNVVFNDYMNCLMGDPTEEKERAIVDRAASLGCEYYCLDCGWYADGFWWDSVGDWIESRERFPNGLRALSDYVRSKGMKMGIWIEIEVMGVASRLASELPDDWFVCRHGKRHIDNYRYLLDFRNPDVRKHCTDVMERLIQDYGVEYFKVDYNVTMGYGSDLNADSCADAMLEHYRCLYRWYEDLFARHPDLVIENCGSGGMRMDYGMLKLLSLQSTSDQTDYIHNSHIAANVAGAVTPEQAGMWVYPYEDEAEHVIYNMVNGLLLRPYISGMVWKLSENSMNLLREGISLYKDIRGDVRDSVPVFPLGFGAIEDEVMAYGLKKENRMYLSVFTPGTDQARIPLGETGKVKEVSVLYPGEKNCSFHMEEETLCVTMPQKRAARLFYIMFE